MSYMALYGVWPGTNTPPIDVETYRNSHGGLTVVWEALAGKYLGVTKAYSYPDKGWMQLDDKLWDMWKDPCIPEDFRLVFMWGFDRAYLARENYGRMAKAIRSYLKAFPPKPECVNHWPDIAGYLEVCTRIEVRDEPPALGIYGTSCGDNCWQGEWDEESNTEKPIDWSRCFEVCKEIDSLKEEVAQC